METRSAAEPRTIQFAFPFRDVRGRDFVDEHALHALLANESGGSFAVSGSGLWHGGIHVTADGAGKKLDLAHGVRCIADGEVVAYRINRTSLKSEIAADGGEAAQIGYYSSAFTLVRHTLEYPANNRLVFFSLYMHLQSLADYQAKSTQAPPYWARSYEVSTHAADRPKPDPHRGEPSAVEVGLNIRAGAGNPTVLGILPHGARVRIGERDRTGKWGKIEAIESGTPMPPRVAGFVHAGAEQGWVYLGKERGHHLLTEGVSEMLCDQIVVPRAPSRINAGDLIGHLGPYWLPTDPSRDHRMVHIEVFCDDTLTAFLHASREVARSITDFGKLPLLRIGRGVKLFAGPSIDREGADAPETAVVQIYRQAALDALPVDCKGEKDDAFGHGEPWWKITSANSRHVDITGWVRNRQMPPKGGVTRESPHAWMDFETISGDDVGNPTIFNTVDAWLDYALSEDKPATAGVGNLKPVVRELYRALSPRRDESRAADELRAYKDDKWLRFRASRLIPKHRSEWASQSEYRAFFEKALTRVAKEPYHDAELTRIDQLVWWGEVQDQVTQSFPKTPDVFHIHPIALVGSFAQGLATKSISENGLWFIFTHEAQANVTNRLHWPRGASGVTLGAGYDMKDRAANEIASDMMAIGLSRTVAVMIASASGRSGEAAGEFVSENRDVVNLADDQQVQLLRHAVRAYEEIVRRSIKVSLRQYEFDALVSFAYNPAGRWRTVSQLINDGRIPEAMNKVREGNTSGGVVMRGLTNRRSDEVNLYLNGRYELNGRPLLVR